MKAVVSDKAGPPDVLALNEIAKPVTKAGWVQLKVKAFGLSRAELFARLSILKRVQLIRTDFRTGDLRANLQVDSFSRVKT